MNPENIFLSDDWAGMDIFDAIIQQPNGFLKFTDFMRYVPALVVKNKRNEIIIPYVPGLSEITGFINEDA